MFGFGTVTGAVIETHILKGIKQFLLFYQRRNSFVHDREDRKSTIQFYVSVMKPDRFSESFLRDTKVAAASGIPLSRVGSTMMCPIFDIGNDLLASLGKYECVLISPMSLNSYVTLDLMAGGTTVDSTVQMITPTIKAIL